MQALDLSRQQILGRSEGVQDLQIPGAEPLQQAKELSLTQLADGLRLGGGERIRQKAVILFSLKARIRR